MGKRSMTKRLTVRALLLARVLSLSVRFPWLGIGHEIRDLSARELGGLLRYLNRIGRGQP